MKRIITALLVLGGMVNMQSQTMPTTVQTTWNQFTTVFGSIKLYTDYINSGDTIITGVTYQKVYVDNVHDTNYVGGYREDLDKKVYYLKAEDSIAANEILLYDFDIQQGDTLELIPLNYLPQFPTKMAVLTEGCTRVYNPQTAKFEERKIWGMQWLTNTGLGEFGIYSWIEGIGSTKGLLWRGSPSGYDFTHGLENVFQLGDTLLVRDSAMCKASNIGLVDLSVREVDVYPNPFSGSVDLNGIAQYSELKVYDTMGKTVFRQSLDANSVKIDLSALNPGLYIFTLSDKSGKQMVRRLLKQGD